MSSKKIFFYNSESDKQNADPVLILDLNKVFHVRSVTQGDVIRADAKEIPRILQILYAGEGTVIWSKSFFFLIFNLETNYPLGFIRWIS